MYKGAGKAYRILETCYQACVQGQAQRGPTPEEYKHTLEKFPHAPIVQIEVPPLVSTVADDIKFHELDVRALIRDLPEGRAQGPSGLSYSHLRYINSELDQLATHIATLGNRLLEYPNEMAACRRLYKFRVQCVPKRSGGFRPICIQEPILTVLHKILARKLLRKLDLMPFQFAFQSAGLLKAIEQASRYVAEGQILLKLDIKNAFNSVPHAQIHKRLHQQCPGPQVTQYIMKFLAARNADELPELSEYKVGVPQGDPLSMLLFAFAIDPVLREFDEQMPVIAYADDVLLVLPPDGNPDVVKAQAVDAFHKIGLVVDPEKCGCTRDGPIEFLGHPLGAHGGDGHLQSASAALLTKCQEKLDLLQEFGELRESTQLTLLFRSILPSVNYGPLVDPCEDDDTNVRAICNEIQTRIAETAFKIMERPSVMDTPGEAIQFLTAKHEHGGMELILPGEYWEAMRSHRKGLIGDECFRSLRDRYWDSQTYLEHHYLPTETPAVGAVMQFIDGFEDDELQALLDFRFAKRWPAQVCPLCGAAPGHAHSAEKCRGYMYMVCQTHEDILYRLMRLFPRSSQPTPRPRSYAHQQTRRYSDGTFHARGGTYHIDVSIVWGDQSMESRYRAKKSACPTPDYLVPFIVDHYGNVYPQSWEDLSELLPSLRPDDVERALLIPLARRQAEHARCVAYHAARQETVQPAPGTVSAAELFAPNTANANYLERSWSDEPSRLPRVQVDSLASAPDTVDSSAASDPSAVAASSALQLSGGTPATRGHGRRATGTGV